MPAARRAPRAKGEVALAEIDRLTALGLRFGGVLADAEYGNSALFRRALSARGLLWAVGIPKVQQAYGTEVVLFWPQARTGRLRRRPVPSERALADGPGMVGAAGLEPARPSGQGILSSWCLPFHHAPMPQHHPATSPGG